MKVNLGCGGSYLDGWVNVDTDPMVRVDMRESIVEVCFPKESVEQVYCSHTLEHIELVEARLVISHIANWLVPEGLLMIAVPDMLALARLILAGEETPKLVGFLFGINYHGLDYKHKWGYTESTLIALVRPYGFSYLGRFEPWVEGKDPILKHWDTKGYDHTAACYTDRDGKVHQLSLNALFKRVANAHTLV